MRRSTTAAKPTRAEAKAQTRQQLIDAAVELLWEGGPQALSTVALGRRIGKSQGTFYGHFRDMDDLLEAAVRQLAQRHREFVRRPRTEAPLGNARARFVGDGALIRAILQDPRWALLAFRHRRDPTTIVGRVMGDFWADIRRDLAEDLRGYGLDQVPNFELFVELVLGMSLGVLEALVDGRVKAPDEAFTGLMAGVIGTYRALGGKDPGAPKHS